MSKACRKRLSNFTVWGFSHEELYFELNFRSPKAHRELCRASQGQKFKIRIFVFKRKGEPAGHIVGVRNRTDHCRTDFNRSVIGEKGMKILFLQYWKSNLLSSVAIVVLKRNAGDLQRRRRSQSITFVCRRFVDSLLRIARTCCYHSSRKMIKPPLRQETLSKGNRLSNSSG